MVDETYYSVLQVPETAQTAEIKEAYLRLIRKVHPDFLANANDFWKSQAEEKAKEANEARDVLSNPEKRRLYDARLAAYRGSSGSSSGTSAAQTSSSHPNSSAQGQSHSSATPGSNSASSHQAAQNVRSNPQQQAPSTPPPPSNSTSQSGPQATVLPIDAGKRFLIACMCIIFGLSSALPFWQSTSSEDQVYGGLLTAIILFGCVAYLYRRKIRPILAGIGVYDLKYQVVVTIGIIACALLVGRIPKNQSQNTLPMSPRLSTDKPLHEIQDTAKSTSTALNAENREPVSVGKEFASRFPWYVETITTMVWNNWYTQNVNPQTQYGTQTKVSFTIGQDGVVSNIRLSVPSSSPTLDRTARQAVERVTRFGELPSGFTGNALTLEYTFTYDQPPRLTEGDQPERLEKSGSSGEGALHFTPEQLKTYYTIYSAPDVQYLRTLFDGYLAGASGHEGEFTLLKPWSPDHYGSKFIVISRASAPMGGTSINLIFQQKPDTVFYAWVFNTSGEQPLELRSFERSNAFAKADMSQIGVAYKSLLEDKDHAM